jgi:hypothetical protein
MQVPFPTFGRQLAWVSSRYDPGQDSAGPVSRLARALLVASARRTSQLGAILKPSCEGNLLGPEPFLSAPQTSR